jgi:hypothetical protein
LAPVSWWQIKLHLRLTGVPNRFAFRPIPETDFAAMMRPTKCLTSAFCRSYILSTLALNSE